MHVLLMQAGGNSSDAVWGAELIAVATAASTRTGAVQVARIPRGMGASTGVNDTRTGAPASL